MRSVSYHQQSGRRIKGTAAVDARGLAGERVHMRIMRVNDTANEPHLGCQAVSDAHARMLGAAGHCVVERFFLRELQRFGGLDESAARRRVLDDEIMAACLDRVDAVVVNGEGTLHHGRGSEYYALLGAAQQLGKATLIVNGVFEANAGWHRVLSRLDDFCVRDARSLAAARAAGVRCRLVPDSMLRRSLQRAPAMSTRRTRLS